MNLSIRTKALFLFVILAGVPVVVSLAVLLPGYGAAVRNSEERYQLIALAEAVTAVNDRIAGTLRDAETIADAFARASLLTDSDASEALLSSAIGSCQFVSGARLEVPSADFDTILNKEGADVASLPRSSKELRRRASEVGHALGGVDGGQASLVVAVPAVPGGKPGFVTVAFYVKPLESALQSIAAARQLDDEHTTIVISDQHRRVVAARSSRAMPTGTDLKTHPAWAILPEQLPSGISMGFKSEADVEGVPTLIAVQNVREQGWAVALWRPQSVALAEYDRVRTRMLQIGIVALLLALVVGFASARAVTKPVLRLAEQAKLIGKRRWRELTRAPPRGDEIGELDSAMGAMAGELEAGEAEIAHQAKLRVDLSRFMNGELVDAIVKGDHKLELGGERAEVSVLFADVVAFTPMAESLAPERVVAMLNELFSVLTELVFRHGGTVDKFLGDSIMAVWGAPIADADHALHAVECAEDMMRFLEAGVDRWRDSYGVELRVAVGINSGEAIVGNIGSDKRMEYTVIGDMVNVAARLETIAAPNQVLVGETTHAALAEDFEWRLLGEKKLSGRARGSSVYELVTD